MFDSWTATRQAFERWAGIELFASADHATSLFTIMMMG
jgi:hypothetical protein